MTYSVVKRKKHQRVRIWTMKTKVDDLDTEVNYKQNCKRNEFWE